MPRSCARGRVRDLASTRWSRASTSASARAGRRRRRSATARSPARCRTSPRWAPTPGEAYLRWACRPASARSDALELVRGAEALAAQTGTAIAGGDVVGAPVLTRLGHGRRLGGERRASWSGATARAPGDLVGRDRRARRRRRGARRDGGRAPRGDAAAEARAAARAQPDAAPARGARARAARARTR